MLRRNGLLSQLDCERSYLAPSGSMFVVHPSKIRAVSLRIWSQLYSLAAGQQPSTSMPPFSSFGHSWAALMGCLLPADCHPVDRILLNHRHHPIGLECHENFTENFEEGAALTGVHSPEVEIGQGHKEKLGPSTIRGPSANSPKPLGPKGTGHSAYIPLSSFALH